MDTVKKNSLLSPLGTYDDYPEMLLSFKAAEGTKIYGCTTPLIPPEIPLAFNILLLKIPEAVYKSPELKKSMKSVYDAIIVPDCQGICSENPFPEIKKFSFSFSPGWGEDASVSIHNSFAGMLRELEGIDIKSINIGELKSRTAMYENLRRTVRGICAAANEKHGILTPGELSLVFEAGLALPPERALALLAPVLEWARGITGTAPEGHSAMLFGGREFPHETAALIESCGINVAEDDSCSGRRCFDLSVNAASDYLFYELLDAYSYRPRTPCTRTAEERYELLYRLLKNHGVETVIFFKGGGCSIQDEHVDFLRVRMMRDSVDPLEVYGADCETVVKKYLDGY